MVAHEGHVLLLTHACKSHAANIGKPFCRLMDQRLTNLLVWHVVDGGHRKWSQHYFSSFDLKKYNKKEKKNTREGRRKKEEREEGRGGGGEQLKPPPLPEKSFFLETLRESSRVGEIFFKKIQ